jgi:hypothetical protein
MDEIYEELVPLINHFTTLMAGLVREYLPKFISAIVQGLQLIMKLIGKTETSAARDAAGSQLDAVMDKASLAQIIGIGATSEQKTAIKDYYEKEQAAATERNRAILDFFGMSDQTYQKYFGKSAMDVFQGRAAGGPVNANTPYIVGEKGPELFMPKNAGDIVSTKQLLGSGQPTGMPEVNAEYQKITNAIRDITKDITDRRDLEDKYTDHNKKYIDGMISLLDQDYNSTVTYMEAGGTPAAMSSGMGLQYGGGMGMTASGSLSGLKIKKGDVHAEGSALSPKLVQLAQAIQSNMPNFNYFSSFNDKFHQEKASSSSHTRGTALDFTLTKPPTPEEGQNIVRYLKSMGASLVIDEYNNPSSNATAGHIHAQIPGFADGGIAMDPTIAMVAEKGPEAMLPLTSDGFLGKLGSSIAAMVPQQQVMIDLLDDIRRSQQATATASERMAAVASN